MRRGPQRLPRAKAAAASHVDDGAQGGDARRHDGQGKAAAAAERAEGDRVRHDRMSLGLLAGYLWKLHHWSNQRRTREFYSLLDQGKITVVAADEPPARSWPARLTAVHGFMIAVPVCLLCCLASYVSL